MATLNIQEIEALLNHYIGRFVNENKRRPTKEDANAYMTQIMHQRKFTTTIPNLVENIVDMNL